MDTAETVFDAVDCYKDIICSFINLILFRYFFFTDINDGPWIKTHNGHINTNTILYQ